MKSRYWLKLYVLPELRKRGFRGSLPHLGRPAGERVHLLSFQFDTSGSGAFCVEAASLPAIPLRSSLGRIIRTDQLCAYHAPSQERRFLGPEDPRELVIYHPPSWLNDPEGFAHELLRLADVQGEPWWQGIA